MYGLFPTMENSFKEVVTKDSFTNRAELLPIGFKNSRKVWILKSSIFVKGTQLLIIRKIGKQFAVGLFFKNVYGISSLVIQAIYPCGQIGFG